MVRICSPAEPTVMGTAIISRPRAVAEKESAVSPESGSSRKLFRKMVKRYREDTRQLAVTPRIAPPAARGTLFVARSRAMAARIPTTSLTTASNTWETEVGSIFPWPWK